MTDISTGNIDPGDNKDADRKNLPMTQLDEDEIAKHGSTTDAPAGEGVGVGSPPIPLPVEAEGEGEVPNDRNAD